MNLNVRVKLLKRSILQIILSVYSLFLIGCSLGPEEYSPLDVEPYCNMPDVNNDGIYELELSSTNWQTLASVNFLVTRDGVPEEFVPIRFASNLYWQLNDTLGYFIHRDLTDNVEYVTYDTTYVTGGGVHDLVSTTNISSMTGTDGKTTNWIAPVESMRGETFILYYSYYDEWRSERVEDRLKIHLE